MPKFIIISQANKEAVQQYIDRLPEGKKYEVEVNLCRKRRTIDQNSLYWLWLNCLEAETGNDINTLHDFFKQTYLGLKQTLCFGKQVIREVTTTDLNTAEFTDYLNKVQAFAASECGVILPLPEDLIFEQFKAQFER